MIAYSHGFRLPRFSDLAYRPDTSAGRQLSEGVQFWDKFSKLQFLQPKIIHILMLQYENWRDPTLSFGEGGVRSQNHYFCPMEVKDANGNLLKDGDNATLTQSLKVKGTTTTLKRGTAIKNIRLTDDPEEIECRVDKVQMVLKTCYLKKG